MDVRHRCDTAAPPFGSWSAWIVLVIGASRYIAVIPLRGACLILPLDVQYLVVCMLVNIIRWYVSAGMCMYLLVLVVLLI